jgi:hypothetical protein
MDPIVAQRSLIHFLTKSFSVLLPAIINKTDTDHRLGYPVPLAA